MYHQIVLIISGVVLMTLGFLADYYPASLPTSLPAGVAATIPGAFSRLGAVAFLLGLALPQLARAPRWLWIVLVIFVVLLAWKPRYLLIAAPLLILYAIVVPKKKKSE